MATFPSKFRTRRWSIVILEETRAQFCQGLTWWSAEHSALSLPVPVFSFRLWTPCSSLIRYLSSLVACSLNTQHLADCSLAVGSNIPYSPCQHWLKRFITCSFKSRNLMGYVLGCRTQERFHRGPKSRHTSFGCAPTSSLASPTFPLPGFMGNKLRPKDKHSTFLQTLKQRKGKREMYCGVF